MRFSRLVFLLLLLVLGLAFCRPLGSVIGMGDSSKVVALMVAEVEDENESSGGLLLTGAEALCFLDGWLGDGCVLLNAPAGVDFQLAMREGRAAETCAKLRRHRWLRMEHC